MANVHRGLPVKLDFNSWSQAIVTAVIAGVLVSVVALIFAFLISFYLAWLFS